MKFFILDDDEKIIRILENIIYNSSLGEVIGSQSKSKDAINDIAYSKPDILLIDLLMPELDGIAVVDALRKFCNRFAALSIFSFFLNDSF